MTSKAATPTEYLAELPADRKAAMQKLRTVILKNLPKGFEETMLYGMISYVVPKKIYPPGYHVTPESPLPFISIASQKNAISFYHMGVYAMPDILQWLKTGWAKQDVGKLDMGKSCIRMKKPEKIPYELIGELVKKISVNQWITAYEKNIPKKK